MQQFGRMHCFPAREVFDLHSTRETGGDDHGIEIGGANGGEEPLFADEAGDFVVFFLVTEGAGHAAAAGVEIDDLGTGDAAEQAHDGPHADERTLVAVGLDEDLLGARSQLDAGLQIAECGFEKLFECLAGVGDDFRFALFLAAEQGCPGIGA